MPESEKKRVWIPLLCAALLIGGMVGAADILQNKEIIFPEAAAIAAGALLKPKLAWRTDSLHTFAAITVCAAAGLCIVLWMPGAVWFQMSMAYLMASGIYIISRTSFAPMISAAVLPVLLQTRSAVYPAAACILTAAILLVRRMLIKCGVLENISFEKLPQPDKGTVYQAFVRWLIASAVIFTALKLNLRYAAAPPLLVAFTEFWKPEAVSRKRPAAVIALPVLCALTGAGCRYLICVRLSAAPALAAMLTAGSAYCIMKRMSLILPPAMATAVLAFLIPENALMNFPLHILCGITVLVGASFLYKEKGNEFAVPLRRMFRRTVR